MSTVTLAGGRTLNKSQALEAVREKNTEVIKQIVTGDFGDGGILNRQQFAQFFQEVQDPEDQLLSEVRIEPINANQAQIDKIGVGEFNMRAVGEGDSAATRSVNTGKVDIDTQKTSLPWDLSREVVEDTIEYENTAEIILSKFSTAFGFETEYLAWQGDEAYDGTGDEPQGFLTINDGWFVTASAAGSPTVDGSGTTLNEDLLFEADFALDEKYIQASNPVFMCNPKQETAYRQSISNRESAIGDRAVTGNGIATPVGSMLMTSSAIPRDSVMYTDPTNLVYAPQRDMRVGVTTESEAVVMNDLFAQYNLTARFDFVIEDSDAVVTITGLDDPAPA